MSACETMVIALPLIGSIRLVGHRNHLLRSKGLQALHLADTAPRGIVHAYGGARCGNGHPWYHSLQHRSALHAVAREVRLRFTVGSTDTAPTKGANGLRLILAMPTFHSDSGAQRKAEAQPPETTLQPSPGAANLPAPAQTEGLAAISSGVWLDFLFILCRDKPDHWRATCQPSNAVRRRRPRLPRKLNYIEPVNTA